MKRGYADTSQGQVHYRTAGEGAPLVLLHATPRSSRIFERLVALLGRQYRVVALDTLGFGNSDPLPPGASMDDLARMVVEAMDAIGLQKASILGYHTGNKIAAAVGASHPRRVDKLLLVGMSHSLVVDRSSREAAIHALVDGVLDQPGPAEMLRRWAAVYSDVSQTWWKPDMVGKAGLAMDDLGELEREVLDKIQARQSVDPVYRANFAFDFAAALAKIERPTLVLEFATEGEKHMRGSGAGIRDLVRGAQLQVFENTDRNVWEREPARVAQAVAAFLG